MFLKELERWGIQDKPECIYNCGKSRFPCDPSKCKCVGLVGKVTDGVLIRISRFVLYSHINLKMFNLFSDLTSCRSKRKN